MYRIRTIVESMREGSLGVSGPRGSGRARSSITSATTLTTWPLRRSAQRVPAPMRILLGGTRTPGSAVGSRRLSARDFILHLLIRLSEAVLDSDAASQPDGQRNIALLGSLSHLSRLRGTHRQWALTSSADRHAPMQDRTRRQLADLRYLRTYTTNWRPRPTRRRPSSRPSTPARRSFMASRRSRCLACLTARNWLARLGRVGNQHAVIGLSPW
jgi:hypothetical protein